MESGCAVEFDQYLDNELVNRIGLEALLITHTTKPPHRSRFLPTPVVRKIADIIKTNQSLVFIRLTGHRFLKNDVECLLEAMEGHMALLELDLYGNNIESEAGLLFSDGLMKIPMLRRANIGGNMILAEERMQLKREFKENKAHFRVLV